MYSSSEAFDFSQASHPWHSDSTSSSVSPTTLDMMSSNPFEMAAEHQAMAGSFNAYTMFDHNAFANANPIGTDHIPSNSISEGDSPINTWTSINSARSSFSSISTDDSMLEQNNCEDMMPPPISGDPPRKRRRRHLDPKIRHTEKLEKNRRAAERCRQKQRAYVGALQERAREEEIRRARLVAQVNQLRDAILSLKESMVTHSGCHDERIKQYLLMELGKNQQRRMSEASVATTPAVTPGVTPGLTPGLTPGFNPGGFPFTMPGQSGPMRPIAQRS